MSELLPCPFCGNAPYTSFSDVWNQTYAQCPSPVGFVGPEVAHGPVGPMTVDRWQDRAIPPASPDSKPTGEDFSDAEIEAAAAAHHNAQHQLSIPRMGIHTVNWDGCTPDWRREACRKMRTALAAIARQRAGGEEKPDVAHI